VSQVCVCVCLLTWIFVILTLSRSYSEVKVIGQSSQSQEGNVAEGISVTSVGAFSGFVVILRYCLRHWWVLFVCAKQFFFLEASLVPLVT